MCGTETHPHPPSSCREAILRSPRGSLIIAINNNSY